MSWQLWFDTSDLITAVEAYPFLWNVFHGDFNNKHKREKAWQTIAARLTGDAEWRTLDQSARTVRVTTVQKRWKNVKDTYTKSLRLQKDSNCKKRPYIHTDALKFLDTIKREDNKHFLEDLLDDNSENESSHKIKIEETDLYENSNIDYSDDTSGTDTQDGTSKKIKTEEIELYENPIADAGHSPEFVQDAMSNDHSFENVKKSLIKDYIVRKEKRAKPKPPPPVVKPKPKIVIEKIEKNDENDPDMLFLLSMLPLFKKLDEEKKMTARIELTQVLQKLLYANK